MSDRIASLLARGVEIPEPSLVSIGAEVDPRRIEAGCKLFPGVRLEGAYTLIRSGARIGTLGPAMLRDTAVGNDVELGSGAFEGAVFLDGSTFGASGHARPGTLFEEGASAAHAVGTKQTILFPFATLGSNINFCDVLLAGGTGPKDHSEVGSGFIHFNFTPFGAEGDKATPSRFGDAANGVWLRSRRVFLGGAGGVAGRVQLGFGTVLAAGSVYRRDYESDRLVYAESLPARAVSFDWRIQKRSTDKLRKNLDYLADLAALRYFYSHFRRRLTGPDPMAIALVEAGLRLLDDAAKERTKQLLRWGDALRDSAAALSHAGAEGPEPKRQLEIARQLSAHEAALKNLVVAEGASVFGEPLRSTIPAQGARYTQWVKTLTAPQIAMGTQALRSLRDHWLSAPSGLGPLSALGRDSAA